MRERFRSTAVVVAASVLVFQLASCSPQGGARILTQAQVDSLDVTTPAIQAAVDVFPKPDDKKRSDALDLLMKLHPLPSAARLKLRAMLPGGNDFVREYGPKVLAYHHIGSTADLAAIEKLVGEEAEPRLKEQQQALLGHLRGPAPPVSVLADSGALDSLLSDALLKAIQKRGRKLFSTVMSEQGPNGVRVSGWVGSDSDDLPEVLGVGGGEVTLGWKWQAKFSDDAAKVTSQSGFSTEITYSRSNTTPAEAPVGAVLRVGRPITFGNSHLPAGSVLVRSDFGWSRVQTAEALQWLNGQMKSTSEIGYPAPDISPNGAMGIAALGSEAKSLLPSVVGLGTDNKTLVYRLRALACIHDASVIPTLQQWKLELKGQTGLMEAIDVTITQIRK
jgi:hypothetical protein